MRTRKQADQQKSDKHKKWLRTTRRRKGEDTSKKPWKLLRAMGRQRSNNAPLTIWDMYIRIKRNFRTDSQTKQFAEAGRMGRHHSSPNLQVWIEHQIPAMLSKNGPGADLVTNRALKNLGEKNQENLRIIKGYDTTQKSPAFSKLLETCLKKKLQETVTEKTIIPPFQFRIQPQLAAVQGVANLVQAASEHRRPRDD